MTPPNKGGKIVNQNANQHKSAALIRLDDRIDPGRGQDMLCSPIKHAIERSITPQLAPFF